MTLGLGCALVRRSDAKTEHALPIGARPGGGGASALHPEGQWKSKKEMPIQRNVQGGGIHEANRVARNYEVTPVIH